MDSHMRTYVNSLFRTPQRALCDPKKTINWHLHERSFAAAAPMLWNDLPLNVKRSPSLDIFKSGTKTHLFQLAYFTWLFKCMCECLVMLLFHVMYFGIGRFSFCSYATRIFTSALVSKGQISVCNICPILKPALYKYHIIINNFPKQAGWTPGVGPAGRDGQCTGASHPSS